MFPSESEDFCSDEGPVTKKPAREERVFANAISELLLSAPKKEEESEQICLEGHLRHSYTFRLGNLGKVVK
ncbi:hypothetical protein CH371_06120 [Leptospira wolffii]|uniref:Uncharacterized protein n=1 Tax=Leptospira wolffii TaxID=409998 RepID=A0A2M9ZGT0_9LEPT|nr:hypothetical protein CH371_06120 [Leptospira wolffii]